MSITSIFGAKFSWTTLYSFGLWIGRNPYKTILGSLLFCAVCSSGMLTWYTLTDDEYLWTPYGSEVFLREILLRKNVSPLIIENVVIFSFKTRSDG